MFSGASTLIYKLSHRWSAAPKAWRDFIDSLNFPNIMESPERTVHIRNELKIFNATYQPQEDEQFFEIAFNGDGRHYLLFVLKFGSMEQNLNDL